jgi:hypothetical protein
LAPQHAAPALIVAPSIASHAPVHSLAPGQWRDRSSKPNFPSPDFRTEEVSKMGQRRFTENVRKLSVKCGILQALQDACRAGCRTQTKPRFSSPTIERGRMTLLLGPWIGTVLAVR